MAQRPEIMSGTREHRPTFFWQGVLIVLPVVGLAGAGFMSLRQDRILAQHDAAEKAQALAEEVVDFLWTKLNDRANREQLKDHAFHLDGHGRLLFPRPAATVPAPRLLERG